MNHIVWLLLAGMLAGYALIRFAPASLAALFALPFLKVLGILVILIFALVIIFIVFKTLCRGGWKS